MPTTTLLKPKTLPPEILSAWEPPKRSPPREWLSQNIYFDERHSAVAGYWNWTLFPYMQGVIEAFVDPHCRQIVLSWGTQLGKTTLLTALIAWMADNDPRPVMIAMPNMEMSTWHHDDRLIPMLQQCAPVWKRMEHDRKKQRRELVDLGTMLVHYGWSGSTSKMSGRSIFGMFISEINVWDTQKSVEGDKVFMALDRCKAFPNHKVFFEGKPTVRGECRLTPILEDDSDYRRYYVPCPYCDHMQYLRRGGPDSVGGLKWQKAPNDRHKPRVARETAYYECEECRGHINDQQKVLMNRKGVWRAREWSNADDDVPRGRQDNYDRRRDKAIGESSSRGSGSDDGKLSQHGVCAGFHLSSLNSPTITFGEYAERFVRAWRSTTADRQAFTNGWDAEAWEVRAHKVTMAMLQGHIDEDSPPGKVIDPRSVLTLTADVQKDRIYYRIRAWGVHGRSRGIRYGILHTDAVSNDFTKLHELLSNTYPGPEGSEFRVRAVGIDARYRRQEVLEFCTSYYKGREQVVWPIQGYHQYTGEIVREKTLSGYLIKELACDFGQCCDELFDRTLNIPKEREGYFSFESNCSIEYLKQLLGWYKKQEKDKVGRSKWMWVRDEDYPEDHFLACERYQIALRDKYGLGYVQVQEKMPQPRKRPTRVPVRRPKSLARGPGGW